MAESPLYEWTAQGVPADILGQWLRSNRWRWLYAERPEATELLWLAAAYKDKTPWTRWLQGRAFAETSELAFWRQADNTYEVRWLATDATPPPAESVTWLAAAPWTAYEETPSATLLHGNRGDGSSARWGEARIPRYLHYPVDSGDDNPVPEQVALVTQRYHRAGLVSLTRLVAVRGV